MDEFPKHASDTMRASQPFRLIGLAIGCWVVLPLVNSMSRAQQSSAPVPYTSPSSSSQTSANPPVSAASPAASPSSAAVSKDAQVAEKAPGAAVTPPSAPADPAQVSAEELRADTLERLKPADKSTAPTAKPPMSKEMRQILEDRLRWLDEWAKALKGRQATAGAATSPESETAELKNELERIKGLLESSSNDPHKLLPSVYQEHPEPSSVSDEVLAEMKDALTAAQTDLKDRTTAWESAKTDPARPGENSLAAQRAERDKIRQRCAVLAARGGERESLLAEASTPEARELARERLINFDWEVRVESERLKTIEARITSENARVAHSDLRLQILEARVNLAKRTVAAIQPNYQAVVDHRRKQVREDAVSEKVRAAQSHDPLERLRARQSAQLLELKELVLKDERALADRHPILSPQDQTALADKAQEDLEQLKQLVEDGRGGTLIALRLNNEFRRLRSQRDVIARKEQSAADISAKFYENSLTEVELDLLSDIGQRAAEFDALLETIPQAQREAGLLVLREFGDQRRVLLERRRKVLEKLAARAQTTHVQILRRLQILDEQSAFVRTKLFWIRDAEPISLQSLRQTEHEIRRLMQIAILMVANFGDRAYWGPISADFLVGSGVLVILPGLSWFISLTLSRRIVALSESRTVSKPAARDGA